MVDELTIFLKDKKEELPLANKNNPIKLIMEFFSTDDKEQLEWLKYNQDVYEKLGWKGEQHFDVISSFWTVFVCALVAYSRTLEKDNQLQDFWKDIPVNQNTWKHKSIFTFGANTLLAYATKFPEMYDIGKCTYASKVLDSANIQSIVLSKFLETALYSNQIKNLASLCHSVANFMPCPPPPYNRAKGLVKRMHDFIPLFIDLIDAHCEQGKSITYADPQGRQVEVNVITLQDWKDWFISNRSKYCLEDYYYIYTDKDNNGHIKGIPFFKSQNLSYPLPREENEITECLDEMVKRIRVRAFRLLECPHRKET